MGARKIGMLHPTDGIPLVPDTVSTFNMTGGSSTQVSDWATSTGVVGTAALAGVGVVRVTGISSAGIGYPIAINLASTNAGVPTSGTSVSSGAGVTIQQDGRPRFYQVPGDSTGFSVFAPSSGSIVVEQWGK